jgi:hypothetical protein
MEAAFTVSLVQLMERMEKLEIKQQWKRNSTLNAIIAFFLKRFNPNYMTSVVTTIGSTVYWPEERWEQEPDWRRFSTQAHEAQHVLDSRKYWYVFAWSYLMPQLGAVLSLGALGAIWNLWYFVCLLFLVLLVPGLVPSPRGFWELRAYRISHAMHTLRYGAPSLRYAERIADIFAGPKYMWMDTNKSYTTRMLMETSELVHRGEPTGMPWLDECVAMVRSNMA